jgi:ABC-type transport system involved in cytochrome bd biosynthesis fused ATPase/permease subunit
MSTSALAAQPGGVRLPIMRPLDRRLWRHASEAQHSLAGLAGLCVAVTCLVAAQAMLLTRLVSSTDGILSAVPLLTALALVLAVRAGATAGVQAVAHRGAVAARTQLQRELTARLPGLGPFWLGRQPDSEISMLSAGGLDALQDYLASYLPRLLLGCCVPVLAVLAGLATLAGDLGSRGALLVVVLATEAGFALRKVTVLARLGDQGATAARQVCTILDGTAPAAVTTPADAATSRRAPLPLSLHGVTLCHPGLRRPVLSDVSMTVHPGEHVTITGPAGAGKSALLAVLLGFAQPAAGVVQYGGTDLARIPEQQWLEEVAWVPQQPHIFAATVAENIALGRPGSTLASIRRAARLAGADRFIESMPAGYRTQLGGSGPKLALGEQQLIELARAFLRDAPVLLLDEPMAHLDAASAVHLQDSIAASLSGRTVIEVTRYSELARMSRRTLVLSDGHLVQPFPRVHAPAPVLPLVVVR